MSDFIQAMFSERKKVKPVMGKIGIEPLDMRASGVEMYNIPKQIINFTFSAIWQMNASCTAEEYDQVHRIAIQALTRNVYDGFYQKLTNLELALYDHDVEKAKEIIHAIKREVGI